MSNCSARSVLFSVPAKLSQTFFCCIIWTSSALSFLLLNFTITQLYFCIIPTFTGAHSRGAINKWVSRRLVVFDKLWPVGRGRCSDGSLDVNLAADLTLVRTLIEADTGWMMLHLNITPLLTKLCWLKLWVPLRRLTNCLLNQFNVFAKFYPSMISTSMLHRKKNSSQLN